jgi:hypothetical protein
MFGAPTATIVCLQIGDTLAAAPRGYTWRLIDKSGEEKDDP